MNSLKEAFRMQNLLKNLNFFGELNLGLILTAVGIVYFKNPNHFAFGGTSGLSILLADLFPKINVGGFMWIINLVLVVLGFVFLGVKCMGWTIYSTPDDHFLVLCIIAGHKRTDEAGCGLAAYTSVLIKHKGPGPIAGRTDSGTDTGGAGADYQNVYIFSNG